MQTRHAGLSQPCVAYNHIYMISHTSCMEFVQGAISDCDAVLVLDPRNALALESRGEVKRMLGDYTVSSVVSAMNAEDTARRVQPHSPCAASTAAVPTKMASIVHTLTTMRIGCEGYRCAGSCQ